MIAESIIGVWLTTLLAVIVLDRSWVSGKVGESIPSLMGFIDRDNQIVFDNMTVRVEVECEVSNGFLDRFELQVQPGTKPKDIKAYLSEHLGMVIKGKIEPELFLKKNGEDNKEASKIELQEDGSYYLLRYPMMETIVADEYLDPSHSHIKKLFDMRIHTHPLGLSHSEGSVR